MEILRKKLQRAIKMLLMYQNRLLTGLREDQSGYRAKMEQKLNVLDIKKREIDEQNTQMIDTNSREYQEMMEIIHGELNALKESID